VKWSDGLEAAKKIDAEVSYLSRYLMRYTS